MLTAAVKSFLQLLLIPLLIPEMVKIVTISLVVIQRARKVKIVFLRSLVGEVDQVVLRIVEITVDKAFIHRTRAVLGLIKPPYHLPQSLQEHVSLHRVIKSLEKEEVKWSELIANILLLGAVDTEVNLEIATVVGVEERTYLLEGMKIVEIEMLKTLDNVITEGAVT